MNKIKQRSRSSRSSDRSSTQSGTYSTSRSRSASDSRLRSQYDRKVTDLEPIKSISSSLEVHTSRGTVIYNGICNGPDYYSRILGPTVDESILVGLKMLINMGFALPNCNDYPPRQELPVAPESATDVASQTESSGTESKTSQTTEIVSSVISSADVPIGVSEETYAVDYEASISEKSETPESISEPPETESESPEPKSVSSENLTNISPSLSSEEQIIEPTKTSTILISEPISEPIMEDTLSKEEEREVSTHNSEKLVEEDPVAEPDVESVVESVKDEEKSEDVIREVSPIKIEEEIAEVAPEKIEEEISEEAPLEKIDEEMAEELSEKIEKEISRVEVKENIPKEIPEEIPEEFEQTASYKSEETRKSEKENEIEKQEFTDPQSTVTEEELQTEGVRIDDDILSLSEVVGNASDKSQDDSETSEILSTFVTPIKESSVNKYRIYRSNFVDEIVVATATYAQDDLPLLHSQEITRNTSIKPSRVSIKESKPSKMSDTDSETEAKETKHPRRTSKESAQESKGSKRDTKDSRRGSDESKKRQERKESKKERKPSLEQSESIATKDRKSLSEKNKSKERRSTMETKKSIDSKKSKVSKTSEKRKVKEEPIQEVTETDITEDTDQSVTTRTLETTSDSSSEGSGYDTSEEKCPTKNKCSKTDKSSSTASILKSSTSSKSKESSTDTYICACHIHANGEQQNTENIRCMCPPSYCPRCETKKTPVVVTCPFITACMTGEEGPNEMPRNSDRTCPCTTAIINDIMKNQNQKNNCDKGTDNRVRSTTEDQKLLCDCYTSTSSTGYTSGSDSNGNMQRGDCPAKGNVRYAITKITEYGRFTTFEVMKSTKKVPKFMPKGLEGVFVLKHKS
ncbi:unnamed protein product [Psylliodes chrysocephalus]|uniref:Uncharacterized protein n=1 Tax=Psylliodes chrysocephalus TaxID=3402493 RepID=A0A9P0D2D9_9CUCU|nr:unnamed protein product [Psylliodes chrysocephala]